MNRAPPKNRTPTLSEERMPSLGRDSGSVVPVRESRRTPRRATDARAAPSEVPAHPDCAPADSAGAGLGSTIQEPSRIGEAKNGVVYIASRRSTAARSPANSLYP